MQEIYDVITRHVGVVVEREKRIEEQRAKSVSLDQQRLLLQREEDALRRKYTTVRHKKQLPVELKVTSSLGIILLKLQVRDRGRILNGEHALKVQQGLDLWKHLTAFCRKVRNKNVLTKASISS